MGWIVGGLAAWLVVSAVAAVAVGRWLGAQHPPTLTAPARRPDRDRGAA